MRLSTVVIGLFLLAALLLLWEYFLGSKAPPSHLQVDVEGSRVHVRWEPGFGIVRGYEVYVVEKGTPKLYAFVEQPEAELRLRPGTYYIYTRAIRPAGPSLESEKVFVRVEGTPPKIFGLRCKEGLVEIVGEDIDECTYSKDGITWAPLQPFSGFLRVNQNGTIFVKCLNRYGFVEAPVMCK